MYRKIGAFFTLLSLTASLFLPFPLPASAQTKLTLDPGFDPNRVLEDTDIFDVSGMSYNGMVDFLRSRGTLADYRTPDTDGVTKLVPDIIWRIATSYKINPKYLLALLQKEQSLVEDPHPTQAQFDWATGYGVCDSCSKNDPSIQEFKGFASQVEWAAKQYREKYLLQLLGGGQTRAGNAQGKGILVDGYSVTPANKATAMLYSYTPHVSGNLNLWRIWRRWFTLNYPDGTIVQGTPSNKTYLISLGQKRLYASADIVATSVDMSKVITVSDSSIAAYPDGLTIQFPNFSLLRDPKKQIWLLNGSQRHLIESLKVFNKFGFDIDEVNDVTNADLAPYTVADAITSKTQFPQGVVLLQKTKTASTYWYVEDNVKHLIPAKVFLALYFQGRNIRTATATTLAKCKTGSVYQLHDGELVRGVKNSAVSVVENDQLRTIPSATVFEAVGWDWKNVVTVPDDVLKAYTQGDPYALHSIVPNNTNTTLTSNPSPQLHASL